MSSKMLLVFCDGTGMDGNLTEPTLTDLFAAEAAVESNVDGNLTEPTSTELFAAEAAVESNVESQVVTEPMIGGGSAQTATNVLRLSRAVKDVTAANTKQIVFYQSGVGSEADFAGNQVTGTSPMQMFGTAVASKIRDAYAFIAQNFDPGDQICIFGFSRGAYTARKLAGLIHRIGLLETESLGFFFKIWRELVDGKPLTIPPGTRTTNIKCVGVWDTVGSVMNNINALSIQDTSLPPNIEYALHAMSLQENRQKFLPTLWDIPSSGLAPRQVLKQVWFPGAHSDVGGGYERHELADLALFWMAGEVQSFINLDLGFIQRSEQLKPDPWGTSQPHNAYMELPIYQRPIIGHETRLESKQVTRTSTFHQSLQVAPTSLTSSTYMVTLPIMKQAFGSAWTPTYAPLNAFETKCKTEWGKRPITGATPSFDNVSDLLGSEFSLVNWTAGQTGLMPPDAIEGGREADGSFLYVGRAPYAGGLHPGKVGNGGKFAGINIPWGQKEINIRSGYELLVGPGRSVRWIGMSGVFSRSKLGTAIAVRGGREADGTPLYVAKATIGSGVHCGKIKEGSKALIPYHYEEKIIENYSVLVYA